MSLNLENKQTQNQWLTPKMEQSLQILQMDHLELAEYVENFALENPVVEILPPSEQENIELRHKLEWMKSDDYRCVTDYSQYYDDDDAFSIDNFESTEETMESIIMGQIREMKLPQQMAESLFYLVGCLDDNGYLPAGLDILSAESGIAEDKLFCAWQILKGMDPPGIGAISLSQCILLQLERKGLINDSITQVVECCLESLAKGNYQMVAEKTGQPVEVIKEYVKLIGETNPKPCAAIGRPKVMRYVVPDLVVTRFIDHFEVILSDATVPRIIVHHDYLKMLHAEPNQETKRYINDKLHQANWVVQSIEDRSRTLLAVGQLIVKKQREFFLKGPKFLVPMNLSDIAGELNLHMSTISRTISGKYLQCLYGSFPLKYFFPQRLGNEQAGNSAASTGIREQLKEMIAGEDPNNPFSDQELANRLTAAGVEISRRTVAKYRDQMGIPTILIRRNHYNK